MQFILITVFWQKIEQIYYKISLMSVQETRLDPDIRELTIHTSEGIRDL